MQTCRNAQETLSPRSDPRSSCITADDSGGKSSRISSAAVLEGQVAVARGSGPRLTTLLKLSKHAFTSVPRRTPVMVCLNAPSPNIVCC